MPEIRTKTAALQIVGSLSKPSKMPCLGWSINPQDCKVGGKLAAIEGSACHGCYAKKGNYARYAKNMEKCWQKRIDGFRHPQWVEAMTFLLTGETHFRWFDAGDLESLEMLEAIAEIARQTPNVTHWLPTREYATVAWFLQRHGAFPENLTVRVSAPMVDGPLPNTPQPTSAIHTGETPSHGIACPAPQQNGECRDCRHCWDSDVETVSYHLH
jgi:hypothetical protein